MMRTNDPRPSPSPAPEEEPPTILDLPIDVLNIITHYLFDALLPHHLTHLAETCATLNAALSDALAAVQADHKVASALCNHCSMPVNLFRKSIRPVNDLYWDNKGLGPSHGLPLYIVLRSEALSSLEQLYLHSNGIGREGAAAISSAVAGGACNRLKHLYLFRNGIGDDGLQALSAAFAQGAMRELETLGLRDNGIGDKGVAALAQAFPPALKALGLEENLISDVGIRALMVSAQRDKLTSLEKLHLSSNLGPSEDPWHDADSGVSALASAIRENKLPLLQRLTVSGQSVASVDPQLELHRICYERRISLAVGVGGMVFQTN